MLNVDTAKQTDAFPEQPLPEILMRLVSELHDVAYLIERVAAAGRIEEGDFTARVPVTNTEDEIQTLATAFNRMTGRLDEQTGALKSANAQLETRRAFIEAVLVGLNHEMGRELLWRGYPTDQRVGAEIVLEPGARLALDVDAAFEHGVLVDVGAVELGGTALARGTLGYVGVGATALHLANPTAEPARVVLLGGEPLGEDLVMWWNFVGRTHEEIVRYRDQWQAESERFGRVEGYHGDRLPAPPLPMGRLRPRGNPPPA